MFSPRGSIAFACSVMLLAGTPSVWSQIVNITHPANSPYVSLQAAINDPVTVPGDTITLGAGTYSSGGTTITVNKAINIFGASEATVFINVSTNGAAWGINVAASGVRLRNFSIIPVSSSGGGYPIHVSNVPTILNTISLEYITINGSWRTAFDIHGADNVMLSHLTATNSIAGNGIQMTGCDGVSLDNITTSGNAWGGVAVYVSGPANLNRGSNNLVLDGTTSSLSEPNRFYSQVASGLLITNVTAQGFGFQIVNSGLAAYTFYQVSRADALAFAAGMPAPHLATVRPLGGGGPLVGPGMSIQAAIDAASPGDTVTVTAGTYTLTNSINVNKANLLLRGEGNTLTFIKGSVSISGTYFFVVSGAGATMSDMDIEKTDKPGVQNMIQIVASNVKMKNNIMRGQYVLGDPDVSRAFEVAGSLSGLLFEGNSIRNLRQPGYINPNTTGDILNNHVEGTRGWVLDGPNMSFSGNTWGSGGTSNFLDIVILSGTNPAFYPDIVAVSDANNEAVVEDQRPVPAVLSIVRVNTAASPGGNGTATLPYQTITPGVTRVATGGTIRVAAGTYAEQVTLSKPLKLRGAGLVEAPTVITPPSGSGIIITSGGASAASRLIVSDLIATGGSNGIEVQGNSSYITLENVSAITNSSHGVHINSTGTIVDIKTLNCIFSDNGVVGFRIPSSITSFDGLEMTGGQVNNNGVNGLGINPSGSVSANITNITVSGTSFSGNGTSASGGHGDLSFFGFNGNAALNNVTIVADASLALQFRGKSTITPLGTVTLTNVNITSSGNNRYGFAFMDYSDVSGVSMTGCSSNTNALAYGLYVENVGSALNIGNTAFGAANGADIVLWVQTTHVDATSATFSTADNFGIEDRIFHKIDAATAGGFPIGLVTWQPNSVFVTINSFFVPVGTTAPSIQRGIDAASVGWTVNVGPGTFSENLNVNKRLTLKGAGSGSNPLTNTVLSGPGSGTGIAMTAGTSSAARTIVTGMYVTNFQTGVAPASYSTLNDMSIMFNTSRALEVGNLQNLAIHNSRMNNNQIGLRSGTATNIDSVTITDSEFNDNSLQGWFVAAATPAGSSSFTRVQVTNTQFNNNLQKGMYVEKLKDAVFNAIQVINSGIDPAYGFNNGIDINLKYGAYSNIQFLNSTITGSGVNGPATDPTNPAAVAIKARDDAPSYSTVPATLDNVVIDNCTISGPENGLRFGEFGKVNNTHTNIVVTNSSITGVNAARSHVINRTSASIDMTGGNTLGGTAVAGMSLPQLFALEDRIHHGVDLSGPGLVRVVNNNLYVTLNSYYTPATATDLQNAVTVAPVGWTVHAGPGNFMSDVNLNKAITLKGQGIDVTTITGKKASGDNATVRISGIGATIEGFTVTRDGNTVADWFTNVKTAGLAIQGAAGNAAVRNNKFTGNRTAIDINFSSGNQIHNNIIDFNRSGMIFRNQCTNNIVRENDITNNWTVGILWLAASTEDATGTIFFNNKIEGNWYTQIENRSLTGGVKNFSGNWLGSSALTTDNTNGAEPGYTAQIPVVYGGSAAPPGGALSVRGAGLADMDYTPWLDTNTDTDVDNGFQGSFATLWVDDDNGQYGTTGRIQEGVNLVTASTVNVLAGTYREQIYINKNVHLVGVAGAALTKIVPPVALMGQPFLPSRTERPIVGVDSLGTSVVIEGFTVDGEGAGNTHAGMVGIQYFKGSGIIRHNVVKRIRRTPFDGTQAFIGIMVNHDYPRSYAQSVEIHNDSVYDVGKGAIVCNHPGVTADLHDNVILGQGPTPLNAQNGIQFGFGATGTVSNNIVADFSYTGASFSASGILGVGSSGTLSITGNQVSQSQTAINLQQTGSYPSGGTSSFVRGNTVTNSVAGTGVNSYYGLVTISMGGAGPRPEGMQRPIAAASPFDADEIASVKTENPVTELATMTATIRNNIFTSGTAGKGTGAYLLALDTSPQSVTSDSNVFSGHAVAAVTDKDPGATLASVWRKNQFAGNNYGLADLTGVLQDARQNWWGDASGPRDVKALPNTPDYNNPGGTGDSVTAFVDYNPWYLDAGMTGLSHYTLNVPIISAGTVNRSPDQTLYLHGSSVTLTAVPDPGYAFAGWSGDVTSTINPLSVTMDDDKNITASFTYLVNFSVVGNGSVIRTPDQATGYAPGTSVGLKAIPAVGWHFVAWSGDTTATADTISVVTYSDRTFTGTFAINQYVLNTPALGGGSVSRVPDLPLYDHGTTVTLSATPFASWTFTGWTGDTVTAASIVTLVMTSNTSVSAVFTGDNFLTITPESLLAKNHRGRLLRPERRRSGSYPNWMNLLEEVVVQGGFQPGATESDVAGGMVIGVSHMLPIPGGSYRENRDSGRVMAWARLTHWDRARQKGYRYTRITQSLEDRSGVHSGAPHGLDVKVHPGPVLHYLLGEQQTLPPKRHNNSLFAEMVALKLNIAASQLGKTTVGFGELLFHEPGNFLSGLSVLELTHRIDTMMTYWRFRVQEDWDSAYSAVYRINRAFAGPLDTLSWRTNNKLVLIGSVNLASVLFLQGSPVPPVILVPTTDETESENEFDESEFVNADGTPVAARLSTNYPNPFNPSTTISFKLRSPSIVTLRVFDMLGREVAVLLNDEEFDEGEEIAEFIADGLSSGVYFYQIDARDLESGTLRTVETRKMMLLK